jgi:1-acyl-sn-glycerol-3-phosphate acyltransferase
VSLDRVNRPVPLLARRVLRAVLRSPLRRWTGFSVDHPERLPQRREPLVITCNHAAFTDTVFLALAVRPRFVVCGAKPRLFRDRRRRAVMAVGNVLRVDDHDQYLADCTALLRSGEAEMGRNPDGMGTFSTWPAEVALAAGVDLLPCHLHGTTRGDVGSHLLSVGDRLSPNGDPETLTERLRTAIAHLSRAGEGGERPGAPDAG